MSRPASQAGSTRDLVGGSAALLSVYLVGSAISFGVSLFAARTLGARSFGFFVYATSWMALLLLGCHAGLRHTVVRFAATYVARRDWPRLRGLVR
ncbi:MAG: hypothetical protein U1E86_01110 [Burkholderiaceae bacterium]